MFDEIANLPVYDGSKFEWRGPVGWINARRLGPDFNPGTIDGGETPAFVVKSHRTGVEKVFIFKDTFQDENGDFDGTRWVSLGGNFEIQIETW
jgi:hypothetical protein